MYVSDFDEGLYVLQIEAGHFNRYGAATPSSTGSVPRMSPEGATPKVGAAKFEIVLNGMVPNGRYAVLFSVGQASQRILGVDVHVDLSLLIASVDGTANSSGTAVIPVAIPNLAVLGGKRVYCQVFAVDHRAVPQVLTASRGTWFGIAQ